MKNTPSTNGFILFEDNQRVVIATGFTTRSENVKTGNMIQIWVLVKAENPIDALRSGSDALVCGGCPLRGTLGKNRACYVNLGQAPLAVWRTYTAGRYATLERSEVANKFTNRVVRFGAYGDPVFMPYDLVHDIAQVARKHTGYTHQWQNPLFDAYKQFFMASADSADLAVKAHAQGWRTFRVAPEGNLQLGQREILCANTTRGVTCEQCGLCNGASGAKSIVIEAHGAGKGHIG